MGASVSEAPRSTVSRTRLALGVVTLATYVVVANTVQQLYPFSVFDMYANRATSASKVVAQRADGTLVDVNRLNVWHCPQAPSLEHDTHDGMPHPYTIPYRDHEALDWIRTHMGPQPQAETVRVVRHIWWLEPTSGQAPEENRVLATCSAVAHD